MYNPQTTDNQEEIYDVVNDQDEVIGKATRREVHANPTLIHRAAGAYIFNSKKELLMQKRSMSKDMFPGYWVFSVGGHVDSGYTYEQTVHREIQEELGIEVSVTFLEKILQREPEETEFWGTYLGIYDGEFLSFNTTEIEELRFFPVEQLVQEIQSGALLAPPNVIKLLPKVQELVDSGKVDELIAKST